ncbi:hypothetical protein CRENBAI_015307 [Crenichthys baileyi]|uniref:Uncharacterized protein n=1 Tax=Crenichthys baileyi TaxID=28760 RepID=A0AAV9R6L6_9TELE
MADCSIVTKMKRPSISPPSGKTQRHYIGEYIFVQRLYEASRAENVEHKKNAEAMSLRIAELQAELDNLNQQRQTHSQPVQKMFDPDTSPTRSTLIEMLFRRFAQKTTICVTTQKV